MVKWIAIISILAACSQQAEAIYASASDAHRRSYLTVPAHLPAGRFVGRLLDPSGAEVDVQFESIPIAGGNCYWSTFISICTGNGTDIPPDTEGPEGRSVRVDSAARDGREYVYYVYDNAQSDADYSIVRDGRLVVFGILEQRTGIRHSEFRLIRTAQP